MEAFLSSILLGFGTAVAALFSIYRTIGLKTLAKHSSKIDIGLTLAYLFVFAGTSTLGVFAAMFAGLFTALFVDLAKKHYLRLVAMGRAEPLTPMKPMTLARAREMDPTDLHAAAMRRLTEIREAFRDDPADGRRPN